MSSATSETTTAPDPVLTAERVHLAHAADCLSAMRAASSTGVDAGVDAWASERLGAARAERLQALAADPASRRSSGGPTQTPRPSTSAAGTCATATAPRS